jgi:hypothetical protein
LPKNTVHPSGFPFSKIGLSQISRRPPSPLAASRGDLAWAAADSDNLAFAGFEINFFFCPRECRDRCQTRWSTGARGAFHRESAGLRSVGLMAPFFTLTEVIALLLI